MGDALTVLVAEDEALIRMDLVETLKDLGFEVVGAVSDGRSAVDLAELHRPNLALLDIKMPEMDGLAAASAIVGLRSTAVVMLTAFSQSELIQRAVAAGAMGYLVKPYKPEELQATLTVGMAAIQPTARRTAAHQGPRAVARRPEDDRAGTWPGAGPSGHDRTGRIHVASESSHGPAIESGRGGPSDP